MSGRVWDSKGEAQKTQAVGLGFFPGPPRAYGFFAAASLMNFSGSSLNASRHPEQQT